jgi:DNA binding domain, excisionase family
MDDSNRPQDSYVSVKTASKLTDVSVRHIRRLISQGKLRATKPGHRLVRIKWADLVAFVEGGA